MARFNTQPITGSVTAGGTLAALTQNAFIQLTGTAPYTVTLPSPVLFPGFNQTFYNATSGVVTLNTPANVFTGAGGSGTATVTVPTTSTINLVSDGVNYVVVGEDGTSLTATTGAFSGNVTINGASATLSVTPQTVTIAPGGSSTIDNVAVGATTRSTGAFTTVAANNAVTLTANTTSSSTGTGTLVVTGGVGVSGNINSGGTVAAVALSGPLTGTIQTAAQANITSVGTLTSLGVGASPLANTKLTVTASSGSLATFQQTGATGYGLTVIPGADTAYDAFTINNAANTLNQIRMFGNGNATFAGSVGVGATSPIIAFQVDNAGLDFGSGLKGNAILNDTSAIATGQGGGIAFGGVYTGSTTTQYAMVSGARENASSGNYAGALILSSRPHGGSVTERMRINSSGNVGIGVTSPTVKLDIKNASATAYNPSTAAFNTILQLSNTTSGASTNALMVFATESNGEWYIGGVENAENTAADFVFASRASGARAERMRINSSGTVFIGNTTTNTNSSKLVVNGTISQTVDSTQYQVVDQSDIGTAPNEIPLNQYLGSMAYQNGDAYYNTGMPVGFRNRIINGAMVIDQRNAGAPVSGSISNLYVLDRWKFWAVGGGAFTVQQSSVSPAGFTNSIVITQTTSSSPTGTNYSIFAQYIEGYNVADFGWGGSGATAVTLSFWVRSSLTGTFGGAVSNGTQARSYPFTYTISFADSWEYKTITIPGDTTGTWTKDNSASILLFWQLGVGATYLGIATGAWISSTYLGANGATQITETNGATLYITGVQLEKGNIATPFDVRPYGTELQLCQRYFQIVGGPGTEHFAPGVLGTNRINIVYNFKQTMRAAPSFTATSFGSAFSNLNIFNGANTFTITGSNENYMATNSASIGFTHGGSTTAGDAGYIYFNSTSGRVAFSAEL